MTKKQFNIRIDESLALKWKEQASRINIKDSEYIEKLLNKILNEKTLLFDKKEIFGAKTMVENIKEERYRDIVLSSLKKETSKHIINTILYCDADWNSPMMDMHIKLCRDFLDKQIRIANELNAPPILVEWLDDMKNKLKEKDKDNFYEKILTEQTIKYAIYHIAKKYGKNSDKIMDYLQGKTRNLVNNSVISKVDS